MDAFGTSGLTVLVYLYYKHTPFVQEEKVGRST
jgi:hypothetical protein